MKWPWVKRQRLEQAQEFLRVEKELHRRAQADATQLFTESAYLKEEIKALIMTKSNLTVACNKLQTELRDCREPPISAEDLRDTLRRLSFLQTQNAALTEQLARRKA